jgi:non-ribosomal peptide synthase protein (TIGR01720 family)
VAAGGQDGQARLAAWLVPADAAAGIPAPGELRSYAARQLPKYMIPAVFTALDALPVTAAGKLDRAALPAPGGTRPGLDGRYIPPATPAEELLAGIWAQVLGLDRVGAQDNFFELGGDSISSIQVVSRARAAGVHVTAAQLFDHPTVAGLAAAAGPTAAAAEQGPVAGGFALSPVQRWFLGRGLAGAGAFSQSAVLEVAGGVEPGVLRAAVGALVAHHDMLRSRYVRAGGQWAGRIAGAEPDPGGLVWVARVGQDDDEGAVVAGQAAAAVASLDLKRGPVARFVLLDWAGRGQLLLAVIHHLAVDTVSWGFLLEDLAAACGQAERAEPVVLPAKTTSFPRWSQRLAELAGSAELADEAGYWRRVAAVAARLPRDHDGLNTGAWAREERLVLGAAQARRLLHEVPAVSRVQVHEVLLAALGMVLGQWAGQPAVRVEVEGHGREDVGADVDVSRTAGWFTSIYPVALPAGHGDPGAVLRQVKEMLRAVPRRGLGYGLLRHLAGEAGLDGRGAEVSFNYLGQSGPVGGGRFRPAGISLGREHACDDDRGYLLEIGGQVGPDGTLMIVWTYSCQVHDQVTVARLARQYLEVLEQLTEYCCGPGRDGYTPADFPLAALDQAALDSIQQRFGRGAPAGETADPGGRS